MRRKRGYDVPVVIEKVLASLQSLAQTPSASCSPRLELTPMDGDGNECDPFNVPEDFWPTTIAIHLGENID